MKNHNLLKPSVIIVVSLLHAGLLALAWKSKEPPEPVTVDELTFVDLGTPEGDDKPLADGAPAPLENGGAAQPAQEQPAPPPPPPQAPEKPKPVQEKPANTPPPKVNAVVRNDLPADVVQPTKPVVEKPPTPAPKPVEPTPKPPAPKPAETPLKPSTTASNNTSGTPGNSKSPGGSPDAVNRQDGGNGGGGSNPNSQRPGNNAGSRDGDGNGKRGDGDKPAADPNAIVNGGYIKLPTVPYPQKSQDEGEEGTVKLSIIVEANGSVSEVKVTQSTGHQRLDAAAVRTARSAGYRPKSVNGTPVRSRFNTSYTFSLE
ncbi:energy transducer TonB [Kingella denitrificans]|jgi:tonB family C-terminal domain